MSTTERDEMIMFDFDSLTPGMRLLLSWLIDQGGAAPQVEAVIGANRTADGMNAAYTIRRYGRITLGTVRALVRRGHLEIHPDSGAIQVGDWAITDACQFMSNPHPVPVMLARAEHLAHQEYAARTADMIKDTWDNRNTESDDV